MTKGTEQEKYSIALHFEGAFVKGDSVTARTLGHSLSSVQRMVDKAVMYEKRGELKKHDALPNIWYPEADLVVQPFEKGCVKIPLVGIKHTGVVSRLRGVLHEPFTLAVSDEPIEKKPLVSGFDHAYNRAYYAKRIRSHENIIANAAERTLRYFSEAVFRDIDNLISPLRSKRISDEERISIELVEAGESRDYEFDKYSSKRFHQIVSANQLGPLVEYEGRLTAFGETKRSDFPYAGKFYSKASKQEHKLLVTRDEHADLLRPFNAKKGKELRLIGSPVMAWGAFDDKKGDVVFLMLAKS